MESQRKPLYRRIVLKLSGEALTGRASFGIDPCVLDKIAAEVAVTVSYGVEVAIVLGGGNFFRGSELSRSGMDRVTADQMGMLATVMNALALRDTLERHHLPTQVLSSIGITGLVEPYVYQKAQHCLQSKTIVVFAAGMGHPFFTTDSTACLRAIEIQADVVLKATKVDGVYTADPKQDKMARRYRQLSYDQVLNQDLKVMDSTAICLCRDHGMPIRVFSMMKQGALSNIVFDKEEGTLVGRSHVG